MLHDLTCRTRWERQITRAVVQVVPLALVLLLVLGFGWISWVGVICGLVLALIYSTAYFDPSVDHRLAEHDYPPAPLYGSSVSGGTVGFNRRGNARPPGVGDAEDI